VILNANIPLSPQTPTRQLPWRVGLFLGIILGGILSGWTISERLFIGLTTPALQTPSGISVRITPERALWLQTHTEGLTLTASCPLDLPKLISLKRPSWILLGDTGGAEEIAFIGKMPEELANYQKAFECVITTTQQGYTLLESQNIPTKSTYSVHLTTPGGWAWAEEQHIPIDFFDHGINIMFNNLEQTLTTALPLEAATYEIFPQTWQGLSDLIASKQGRAFFSWEEEKNNLAISIEGDISDESLLELFSNIGEVPTTQEKNMREDDTPYTVTMQEKLSLIWINESTAEVRIPDLTPIGFITKQDGFTLISTEPTTWILATPHWESPLNQRSSNTYTAHTLANFGDYLFITKNMLTLFQK
jgi:hypothetical protein